MQIMGLLLDYYHSLSDCHEENTNEENIGIKKEVVKTSKTTKSIVFPLMFEPFFLYTLKKVTKSVYDL